MVVVIHWEGGAIRVTSYASQGCIQDCDKSPDKKIEKLRNGKFVQIPRVIYDDWVKSGKKFIQERK